MPIETLRVERPAAGGAVGHTSDGRVVFVRHSLPGEKVKVRITESTSTFYRGDAVEVLGPEGQVIAKGLVRVSAETFFDGDDVVVHRDDMVLLRRV